MNTYGARITKQRTRICVSFPLAFHIETQNRYFFAKTGENRGNNRNGKRGLYMDFYRLKAQKANGGELDFNTLKGKVLLIVNTATGCGFTPQYEELEALYRKYHAKGLEILDFPCDQFGHQAPGSDEEIRAFCTAKYQTSFEQLKKTEVNGENASPVWKHLKEHSPEEYIKGLGHKASMKAVEALSPTCKDEKDIKWNFTKFLVDRNGKVAYRYAPVEKPSVMEKDLVKLLNQK